MSDDGVYLGDILERIERIEAYTQDGRETFLASLLIQDGVIHFLELPFLKLHVAISSLKIPRLILSIYILCSSIIVTGT